MKRIYLDRLENRGGIGIYGVDAELIPAGTTLYSMSAKDKNAEYKRYADTYDLRFIFDDNIPEIDFYTVPHIDIFAQDSLGGLFGTIGQITDMESDSPICYIDKNKNCFFVADNLKAFLGLLPSEEDWKTHNIFNHDVTFYRSKADAARSLDFLEIPHSFETSSR
ncbi:hypothetical protein [Sinanaerobacter sp. ZZT-01]|uniref:hypothetical protein n=1 Tax=Sinanaerobacter sp. ZZT-01 TaxID=3111540 RepID=UPI002D79C38D|nr:hypothetical protein [Sinanaerobacter sp. ZZT-01]WRR94713.1 hypothetical protein U5921_06265 [Sinanaerobacter sp. ZZT-01]